MPIVKFPGYDTSPFNRRGLPPVQPRALTLQEFLAARGMADPYSASGQQAISTPTASGGGVSGALELARKLSESSGSTPVPNAVPVTGVGVAIPGAASAGGTVFSSGATFAGEAVGSAAGGGTLMSTGVVVPAAEGAPIASAAGNSAAAGVGSSAYLLPGLAAGAYIAKTGYDFARGKKLSNLQKGALALPTAGLSLFSDSLQKRFGLGPSTREIAKKHTADLLGQNKDDQRYQNYVSGMREQYNSGPPDPSKPFFNGKYGSWDEYRKAGLDAGDLTGVYGNLKTFGKDWTNLDLPQQKAVTQAIIDAGLYNSKKGEVEITDQERAKAIYNEVSKSGFGAASPSSGAMASPQQITIRRSNTVSPGIDKSGRRITYGGR